MVFDLLAESVSQAREPGHPHAHRQVLPLFNPPARPSGVDSLCRLAGLPCGNVADLLGELERIAWVLRWHQNYWQVGTSILWTFLKMRSYMVPCSKHPFDDRRIIMPACGVGAALAAAVD